MYLFINYLQGSYATVHVAQFFFPLRIGVGVESERDRQYHETWLNIIATHLAVDAESYGGKEVVVVIIVIDSGTAVIVVVIGSNAKDVSEADETD